MLQDFWPGNGSIFSNMADKKNRSIRFLCESQKFRSAFPYLRNTAWSRFDMCRM